MVGLKCLGSRLSNEILLFSFYQLNKEAADADVGGKMESLDGQHSTRVRYLLLDPAATGTIPSIPKK